VIEIVQVDFGRVQQPTVWDLQFGEQVWAWKRSLARLSETSICWASVDYKPLTAFIFGRGESPIDHRWPWGQCEIYHANVSVNVASQLL